MPPPSEIKATSSRRPKRTHISPKKGSDNCLACNIALENDSYAILCDGCDKWICTECLDMPEPEYLLITKISRRVDICIKCPACKYGSTSVNTQNPSVENIVKATIDSMKNEIIDKIPSQAAFQEIVQASLKDLETSLKAEISQTVSEIKSQVSALETRVSEKCSLSEMRSEVQTVVLQETTSIKANLTQHLDSEIQRHFSEERDRQRRALNIVAFGIPPQPNDQLFIKSYIDQKYKLRDVHINNVRRLPIPTNSLPSARPPPVLFTVPSLDIKRSIINRSRELHEDIQFRGDASKTERNRRKALVEELKRRISSGEPNLMIFKGQIVPKNEAAHRSWEAPPRSPPKQSTMET